MASLTPVVALRVDVVSVQSEKCRHVLSQQL